jgi:hypothetical protein
MDKSILETLATCAKAQLIRQTYHDPETPESFWVLTSITEREFFDEAEARAYYAAACDGGTNGRAVSLLT